MSDDTDREQRIRELAYRLWEEDGRPDGREDEYWHRARVIIEKDEGPDMVENPPL